MPNDITDLSGSSFPSKAQSFGLRNRSRRGRDGVVLIVVLAALAVITVVVLGFTLAMQLESQASQSSLVSIQSDAAVQAAISHATALLAQNIPPVADGTHFQSLKTTSATNWWVNPGLLSTQVDNKTVEQIPLYTTGTPAGPTFDGTAYPPTDTAPSTADATGKPAEGVDLNRQLLNGTGLTITGSDPANQNPMLVYWQYVAQDPTQPHDTKNNPYVSRYAYWMEPENSRIDITTAIGKDASNPGNIPDAAAMNGANPNYALPTFNSISINNSISTSFTLGNPATIDLSVLSNFTDLDTKKLVSAQQNIMRGTAVNYSGVAFNLLPLGTDPTVPATLDSTEQIKNFVKGSSATAETFFQLNKFAVTNYSRDPEFNAFGGARLYPNNYDGNSNGNASWYDVYDLHPTYQYFWNVNEPTWFDGAGLVYQDAKGQKQIGGYGRIYGGILYLSQIMANKKWPGYTGTLAAKWNKNNPGREADQVAWNLYGLACSMQDFNNTGDPGNDLGGTQGKFYLYQNNITDNFSYKAKNLIDLPNPSSAAQPSVLAFEYSGGGGLWSGTQPATGDTKPGSASRYSAQGCHLNVQEVGIKIRAVPNPSGTPGKFRLRFSLGAEFATYPGYTTSAFPLDVQYPGGNHSTTAVTVSYFEYRVNGGTPIIVGVSPNTGNALSQEFPSGYDYSYSPANPLMRVTCVTPGGKFIGGSSDFFSPNNYFFASTPTSDNPDITKPDPKQTNEYCDPTDYTGPVSVSGIKIKIACAPDGSSPIQVSPLLCYNDNGSYYGSLENLKSSNTSTITFPFTWGDPSNEGQLSLLNNSTPWKSMEIDDPRLSGLSDTASSLLTGGWHPAATPFAGADSILVSAGSSILSKLALPPPTDGSNYYPFPPFNNLGYVSPGELFFASTGMQAGKPWTTLSLQPGGKSAASGGALYAPISSNRGGEPPDYLILDLMQAPYRYESMNSSQGKININSIVYPSYFGLTRLTPLEALFANTKLSGNPVDQVALATAIQKKESDIDGFHYAGELCEVDKMGQSLATDFQKEGLMRNLAGLITTRSNSFGIWGAAEAIKEKADGSVVTLSDRRFHAIIERYVWPGVDGLYGNAYVDTSGNYSKSSAKSPGDAEDAVDGPDAFAAPVPTTYPNTSIPLNMTTTLNYTTPPKNSSPGKLETACNPTGAYMRFRTVNFQYLTD